MTAQVFVTLMMDTAVSGAVDMVWSTQSSNMPVVQHLHMEAMDIFTSPRTTGNSPCTTGNFWGLAENAEHRPSCFRTLSIVKKV